MSISGSEEDEHDIITLQYTEEGLLSIDENREGRAAAFGDDIALECIATEFKREVYVVCDIFCYSCFSLSLYRLSFPTYWINYLFTAIYTDWYILLFWMD
jgi:hypothetical protein